MVVALGMRYRYPPAPQQTDGEYVPDVDHVAILCIKPGDGSCTPTLHRDGEANEMILITPRVLPSVD